MQAPCRFILCGFAVAGWLGLAGCGGNDTSSTSAQTSASTQPSTKPAGGDLANVRQLLKDTPPAQQSLPSGHPPVGDMTVTPPQAAAPPGAPLGTLKFQPPADWKAEPVASGFRVGQYRLPRADGDPDDGELAVFDPRIGGGVEMNLSRWRSQFQTPEGQPIPDDAFVRETLEANGLKVTLVDMHGRYTPTQMMASGPAPTPKDSYRMLAAIVETPGGLWYFKAVGPISTLAKHRAAFVEMLKGMRIE